MKTTIEFDGDVEREEIMRSILGPRAFAVLWDVDQHIRLQIKHGELSEAVENALQSVRDYLHTSAAEHGITVDA